MEHKQLPFLGCHVALCGFEEAEAVHVQEIAVQNGLFSGRTCLVPSLRVTHTHIHTHTHTHTHLTLFLFHSFCRCCSLWPRESQDDPSSLCQWRGGPEHPPCPRQGSHCQGTGTSSLHVFCSNFLSSALSPTPIVVPILGVILTDSSKWNFCCIFGSYCTTDREISNQTLKFSN